ncbi:ACP S-malonyltransferase [Crocosphaera sp. Alani8]|uniref:ACP S-malonyltransferase n=1 Tax=Crocosphaera sp. Alani8 TaxID=3038952 RepID=UPI00313DFD13
MTLLKTLPKSKRATVWVFPGQGSQKLGMGLDLQKFPLGKLRLQQAEDLLGWSISDVWQSENTKLSNTQYTQPCLYVFMTLLADLMKQSGYGPDLVTGYSFGEYVALYTAGAYDFETGLKLIKKRAEIMSRLPQGSMATLIGFEVDKLREEVFKTSDVWLANDDTKYAVISGTSQGIASILSNVPVERVIPLEVSAAFHTPLVEPAAKEFQAVLETTSFDALSIPVLSSTNFVFSLSINQVKESLVQQISQSVKWQMISKTLINQGVRKAIQIGCGQGLLKPMKNLAPELEISNVGSTADIDSLVIRDQLKKLFMLNSEAIKR